MTDRPELPAPRSPAMDPATVEPVLGTSYPPEFAERCAARAKRQLGEALGLERFGVNLVTLPPGTASSQRHWHSHQDEFIYVVEGEITLVTGAGEQLLGPGMVAGFPAGKPDGHHLVNRSDTDVVYLEVGDRPPVDDVDYPDIDMLIRGGRFVRRDGTPY